MRIRTSIVLAAAALATAALATQLVPADIEAGQRPGPAAGAAVVHFDVKVIRATEQAIDEAGVRIADLTLTRLDGSGDTDAGTEPTVLLDRATGHGGVTLVADLAFSARPGAQATFESEVAIPTSSATSAAGGAAIQGFSGYVEGGVSLVFRATSVGDRGVLLDVEYKVTEFHGEGVVGFPPMRSSRQGKFTAMVASGETDVQGGMIRTEAGSEYLLFFVQPTLEN